MEKGRSEGRWAGWGWGRMGGVRRRRRIKVLFGTSDGEKCVEEEKNIAWLRKSGKIGLHLGERMCTAATVESPPPPPPICRLALEGFGQQHGSSSSMCQSRELFQNPIKSRLHTVRFHFLLSFFFRMWGRGGQRKKRGGLHTMKIDWQLRFKVHTHTRTHVYRGEGTRP